MRIKKLVSALLVIAVLTTVFTGIYLNAAGTPKIVVESKTVNAGDDVTLSVSIENNPGIVSMILWITNESEEELTLTSVSDAGLLAGGVHGANVADNPYKMTWSDGAAKVNNTANGKIAEVTLSVSQTAEAGDYYVWFGSSDSYNVGLNGVYFDGAQAVITVAQSSHTHSFTNYVYNNDATCERDGTETATCDNGCGQTSTRVKEGTKLGHKFTNYLSNNDATCGKDGTETATCDNGCGTKDTRTRAGTALTHQFVSYIYNNDATCEEDGTESARCAHGCGTVDTRTKTGTALGHQYTSYTYNNDATCEKDGTETARCANGCGKTDTRTVAGTALGHKFTTYVYNDDATCEKNGTETATCDNGCGKTDTREVAGSAKGHDWGDWVEVTPATPQANGVEERVCKNDSSHKETRPIIYNHTHEFGEYVSDNNATCTEDGTKTRTCSCGITETVTDVGSALGHDIQHHDAKSPTCTEAGNKAYDTCKRCDYTTYEKIPALGHDYQHHDGKAASCTEDGYKAYDTCSRCDYTTYEAIAALGHAYTVKITQPTCEEKGYTTHTCSRCQDSYVDSYTDAIGHDWDEWTVSKPATHDEEGVEERICKNDRSHRETRPIPVMTDPILTKIDIDTSAMSLKYQVGSEFYDVERLLVIGTYDDGAVVWLDPEEYTVEGYSSEREGKLMITVKCGEFIKSFEIEIIPKVVFNDVVETQYYAKPVQWAVERGITAGTSDTTFSPDSYCTRGQIVSFLWRSAGKPEPKGSTNPFTDVTPNDYFYKAVLWAVENEITAGMTPTTFGPNNICTRGQTVTFLYRAAGKPEPTSTVNPFTDVSADQYYYKPVLWAVEKKITAGTSDTTFSPNANCTRGQIVTFLYRAETN